MNPVAGNACPADHIPAGGRMANTIRRRRWLIRRCVRDCPTIDYGMTAGTAMQAAGLGVTSTLKMRLLAKL
jgi:hypothetical protein